MTIEVTPAGAVLSGIVGIDETDALYEWCVSASTAGAPAVDLHACTHLHAANLQVLIAAHAQVVSAPANADLAGWLHGVLTFTSNRDN